MGVVYKAEDTRLHRFVTLNFPPETLTRNGQALQQKSTGPLGRL